MLRVVAASVLTAIGLPAVAADDPIAARQALMTNNGASAAVAGGIMKGEIAYSPAVGKAVIEAWAATAATYGDYFPDGSVNAASSRAAPRIWEDMAGFTAEIGKFQTAVATAREASGRDGPPDAAAFGAAVQPVFATCQSCHETYRLEQ